MDKVPLRDRLRATFLKPAEPGSTVDADEPQSVEEIESAIKRASDKERLIGLIAAPWAAAIGILITTALIANDPAPTLSNGLPNKLHVSQNLYREAMAALVVLSIVILAMSLLRKRLYLGIVLALYGLTVFNLHYWGFGVPFILAGAWYLVRGFRLQRSLREATGDTSSRFGSRDRMISSGGRPRSNKRYTPPSSSR